MSRISALLNLWQDTAAKESSVCEYTLPLPVTDLARISALSTMYPGRTKEQIIVDLLSVALNDLEEVMPYIPGPGVISRDEFGDPIFEDIGPTPRFEAETKKYLEQYRLEIN